MADDRVEPRVTLVGRGIGATPESIDDLKKRARQIENLTRRKPAKKFAELLDGEGEDEAVEPEAEPEKAQAKLKPGLVHPAQKQLYGREDSESVILKG